MQHYIYLTHAQIGGLDIIIFCYIACVIWKPLSTISLHRKAFLSFLKEICRNKNFNMLPVDHPKLILLQSLTPVRSSTHWDLSCHWCSMSSKQKMKTHLIRYYWRVRTTHLARHSFWYVLYLLCMRAFGWVTALCSHSFPPRPILSGKGRCGCRWSFQISRSLTWTCWKLTSNG